MNSSKPLIAPKRTVLVVVFMLVLSFSALNQKCSAGTVVGWGENIWGQLDVPPDLTNVIAVAASLKCSLALKADGKVVGWGSSEMDLSKPPATLSNVISISAGLSNSLALKSDGTVVVWGRNQFGPLPTPAGLTNIVAAVSGWGYSFALRNDGVLFSWLGWSGSLVPVQSNIVVGLQSISPTMSHTVALTTDGELVLWGNNSVGQCDVIPGLSNVIGVAAGNGFTLALKSDRTVVGWGKVWSGSGYEPVAIPADATNIISLSVCGSAIYALKADGTVMSWGPMSFGVPDGLTNVIAIAVGPMHCLALIDDAPPKTQVTPAAVALEDEQLTIAVPTQSGRVYRLEQSDSLSGTNWSPLPLAPGNGAVQTLIDPAATNASGFYRIRQW